MRLRRCTKLFADVAELADALDSGSSGCKTVQVQVLLSAPDIIYNLIMFIRPAFEEFMPLGRVYSTTVFSIIMAAAGAIFAYFCILPGTLNFFSGFQISGLQALISADDYLNFVTNIIITYVIIFQIPLLIVFIDRIKPIPPRKMLEMEKWVILGSLIVATLVPFAWDLMTCLFIALPIVVLYNISIILVVTQHARIAQKERAKAGSIIVKPKSSQEFMAEPDFSFDKITAELISEGNVYSMPDSTARRNVMDVQRIHYRPATVQPAEWFRNRPKQVIALSKQVNIISDIRRAPRINRVLN